MADDSLFYYPGSESIYGLAGSTLAQSLPALVNPYASTGQNLAVTLGGGLVAALLGFKARQDANEAGIRTQELANAMLSAESPAARRSIIESAPGGFFEPNVQGRLLKLDTVLTENELKAQQAARQQQRMLETQAQMQLSPLGQALNQQEIANAVEKQRQLYQLQGEPGISNILDQEAERRRRQISGTLTPEDFAARRTAQLEAEAAFKAGPSYAAVQAEELNRKQAASDIIEARTKRLREQADKLAVERERLKQQLMGERDRNRQQLEMNNYAEKQRIALETSLQDQIQKLGIPSREYVSTIAERQKLVAEVDALAARWEALNGGKGASALEVKANLNNSNTEIGDLRNQVLAKIGSFIQLNGLSKAQSDLDTKLFMRSIFGEFYGMEGVLDSKSIADNIRRQVPDRARITVDDAVAQWRNTINRAFQTNPAIAERLPTDPTIQSALGRQAADETKLPTIQSYRTMFSDNLRKEAQAIGASNLPQEEKVRRLQGIKLQLQALGDPTNDALQQQAASILP